MDKKWVFIVCSFSVLTFIISLLCSFLIFSNEANRTNLNSESILNKSGNYQNLLITYYHNNNIRLNNINPGYTLKRKFSFKNNNSNNIKYSIKWQNITSTWDKEENGYKPQPQEFVYNLSCSNGINIPDTQMPLNEGYIIEDLLLKTNQENTCLMNIKFIKKDNDQTYNLNKTFMGEFVLEVQN